MFDQLTVSHVSLNVPKETGILLHTGSERDKFLVICCKLTSPCGFGRKEFEKTVPIVFGFIALDQSFILSVMYLVHQFLLIWGLGIVLYRYVRSV